MIVPPFSLLKFSGDREIILYSIKWIRGGEVNSCKDSMWCISLPWMEYSGSFTNDVGKLYFGYFEVLLSIMWLRGCSMALIVYMFHELLLILLEFSHAYQQEERRNNLFVFFFWDLRVGKVNNLFIVWKLLCN